MPGFSTSKSWVDAKCPVGPASSLMRAWARAPLRVLFCVVPYVSAPGTLKLRDFNGAESL
jgi:hypothetical protein